MTGWWLRRLLLLAALAVSACGSTGTGSGEVVSVGTASSVATTPSPAVVATAPSVDAIAAPTTAIMAQLKLKGETFAARGDPNAAITVVEFSDFG